MPTSDAADTPDAPIVVLFAHPLRWFTTVGLQGALALFFVFFPERTMDWFRVPRSVELGIVYQLFGGLLMFRAVMEQYVRSAREPAWMRRYMIASFPFNMGLAYFLGYAALAGLMNFWVGVVFSLMAVAELLEYTVALVRSAHEPEVFRSIAQRCAAIDWAMLPIGAYSPEWFLETQHIGPEDAGRAFRILGARRFVAMHHGTFRLTDEPMDEPLIRCRKWFDDHDDPERLWALDIGETRPLD